LSSESNVSIYSPSKVGIRWIATAICTLCFSSLALASPPQESPPADPPAPTEPPAEPPAEPAEPAPVEVAPEEPPAIESAVPVQPYERPEEPGITLANEKAERDAAYEAEFLVPGAPAVPHPPGRQNILNRPIKSHEWDSMEMINSDRPDFTDVLPSVKKYMWQTESGYSFSIRERRGGSEDYAYHRHRFPETLLRYGLTERLELRLRWDSAIYASRVGSADSEPKGMAWSGELLFGFKWQAILQDGWKPAHTIMGTLLTRAADGNVVHPGFEPGFNWVYGWQIRKFMVLRGSTGFEYVTAVHQLTDAGDQPGTHGIITLHQSVVTYLQWVPRLGTYTEWFSFYDFGYERGYQHNFGQGFYFYVTPNVQIDLRCSGTAFSAGDRFRDLTVGSGLSLRGFYHKRHREQYKRQREQHKRPRR
jgi:hypothetical protein